MESAYNEKNIDYIWDEMLKNENNIVHARSSLI